jgi:hypothetical protein
LTNSLDISDHTKKDSRWASTIEGESSRVNPPRALRGRMVVRIEKKGPANKAGLMRPPTRAQRQQSPTGIQIQRTSEQTLQQLEQAIAICSKTC